MSKSETITATAIATSIASGKISLDEVVQRFRKRIEEREESLHVFQHLDWQCVEAQVERLNAIPTAQRGPLYGVPIGVKDIFDTVDMPTSYGSPIYAGHRPGADAACVTMLRDAGAIIVGKTVTTEFAFWNAGPTRNPLDMNRTPGGSSSGSAAGVAAGYFPLAVGSQTAASTIRPASYCGIIGFKPSRKWISRTGVKPLAASLDSVGVFAKTVADAGLIAGVMSCRDDLITVPQPESPPQIAVWKGREYGAASSASREAVESALASLASRGSKVIEVVPGSPFTDLTEAQALVMAREAALDLAYEHRAHRDILSAPLLALLEEGTKIRSETFQEAHTLFEQCQDTLDDLFGGADLLIAPSTLDEAPLIENGTGNPDMSRAWTALDLPSLTLPFGTGPSGMPLGLQIAARPDCDHALLSYARWIEAVLDD